jgi:hypothetical protein
MDIPRVSDSVERITVLRRDPTGALAPVVIYEREGSKKKRGTRALRPFERAARRFMEAQRESAESYLRRHQRSNEKQKDGWIADLPLNVFRATQRGTQALKLERLLLP